MKKHNGKEIVKSSVNKRRIEADEELIPTCPRCPDEVATQEVDCEDGLNWYCCPLCDGMFEEVEVSWMDEADLEEGHS